MKSAGGSQHECFTYHHNRIHWSLCRWSLIYAYSAQAVRDNRDIYEAKIERLTKDHEKLVAENAKLMYFINQQQAEKRDFKFGQF